MPSSVIIAGATLLAVLLVMAGEAVLAAHNERVLRQRGAVEPPGDVYATTRWAYPACFAAMALEGALTGPAPPDVLALGLALFGLSKSLKLWVMNTLGIRWTFRLLVLPDLPRVTRGPYAVLRHPNYVAVVGEMIGVAMMVWAPVAGLLAVVGYGRLLLRRIAVEDRALGRSSSNADSPTGVSRRAHRKQ